MNTLHIYFLNLYAFIILLLIYYDNRKNRIRTYSGSLFTLMVIISMALTVIDSLSWFINGKNISFGIQFNYAINILFYSVLFVPSLLWLNYVQYSIYQNPRSAKYIRILSYSLFSLHFSLAVSNILTGWYFYIDANNVYHRGPYALVPYLFSYFVLLAVFIMLLINKKRIEKQYFKSLLIYPLPMLIASVVQLFIYGISLICSSTVSMLIIYFNIQNTGLNSDYLTGVYNRRLLDSYIRERISLIKKMGSFSGMLIDLNKFKCINDEFGHHTGDEALKDFADILRACLRSDDLIARFGGDEFFILLNIGDKKALENVADRIKTAVDEFNNTANKVYKLSYSIGYDIYPATSGMNSEQYIEHLDRLMYQNKLSINV